MVVIEMNPRVSRSSALASKATGFPIAWVATKLALGYRLWELPNVITGRTKAAFEPVLDYVVVKVPRFTFEKFPETEPVLGIQMKSVGEAMAIGRSFQEALQKALRSLEEGYLGLAGALRGKLDLARLKEHLLMPGPQRIFWIYRALQVGHTVAELSRLTNISPWFIQEMEEIMILEGRLRGFPLDNLPFELLLEAKRAGFADAQIGRFCGAGEEEAARLRRALGLRTCGEAGGHLLRGVPGGDPVPLPDLGGALAKPRPRTAPRPSSWAAAPTASARGWSSTAAACRRWRPSAPRGWRPSWSTATPRRSAPTSTSPTASTSSPSPSKT